MSDIREVSQISVQSQLKESQVEMLNDADGSAVSKLPPIFKDTKSSQVQVAGLKLENLGKKYMKDDEQLAIKQQASETVRGRGREAAQEEEVNSKSEENKQYFVDKFGVKFQIPQLKVQKAAIFNPDPQYCLQVVNYIVPKDEDFKVQTHFIQESTKTSKFKDLFKGKIDGFAIRLLKADADLKNVERVEEHFISEFKADGKSMISKVEVCFSPNGQFFMIFYPEVSKFKLFSSTSPDISELFDKIKLDQPTLTYQSNEDMSEVNQIQFGEKSKYLAMYSPSKLFIFTVADLKQPLVFNLDAARYDRICDVFLEADSESSYKCIIACKLSNFKKVVVAPLEDFQAQNEQQSMVVNYFHDTQFNFDIKISVDEGRLKVLLTNGEENFVIDEVENSVGEKEVIQKNLGQLENKKIIYSERCNDTALGFNLIGSDDYDEYLTIFNSSDIYFKVKIKRNIQPGIITIFDFHFDTIIRLLSLVDDEFVIDKVNCSDSEAVQTIESEKASRIVDQVKLMKLPYDIQKHYVYASVRAFSINWPYVSFSGLGNYILIINAFDGQILQRVQIAQDDENIQICETYLSNSKDLFVIILKEGMYQLYSLDLDMLNKFESSPDEDIRFTLLLEYSQEEVNYAPLQCLHARGSSRKELVQLNEKLTVLFLHSGTIYCWIQGQQGKVLTRINPLDRLVTSEKFMKIDESNLIVVQKSISEEEESVTDVCQIIIRYCDYDYFVVARESSFRFDIINFNVDRQAMKLILVLNELEQKNHEQLYLKFIDLHTQQSIFEVSVEDSTLKGLFKFGINAFSNGHIYYANNVIKVRYDLMTDNRMKNLKIEEVLNEYRDILDISPTQRVKMFCPLDSILSHKLGYIIQDSELEPTQLIILPYLHERKIFLNRVKFNTNYFYTSIEHELDLDPTIVCFNLTESKMYWYSEKGILLNRIKYSDVVSQHGPIQVVSRNGLNLILSHKGDTMVSIFTVTEKQLLFVRKIDFKTELKLYLEGRPELDRLTWFDHWLQGEKSFDYQISNQFEIVVQVKKVDGQVEGGQEDTIWFSIPACEILNDQNSEAIKEIRRQHISQDQADSSSFFNSMRLGKSTEPAQQTMNLLFSSKYSSRSYKYSSGYGLLILFTRHKLKVFSLSSSLDSHRNIRFKISESQPGSEIRDIIITGPSTVDIVVDQKDSCLVIQWDIDKNVEIETFEIDSDNQLIWNAQGDLAILMGDNSTLLAGRRCKTQSYNFDNFVGRSSTQESQALGYEYGSRLDRRGHNWLILREYLCLGFSYMTFVIGREIEQGADQLLKRAFDPEPFTFVLNKQTCFTQGNWLISDYSRLKSVLSNLERINPNLLEMLHFTSDGTVKSEEQEIGLSIAGAINAVSAVGNRLTGTIKKSTHKISPIHNAIRDGNNRVAELILSYMSKIEFNSSRRFKDVLHEMTDFQSFQTYLEKMPQQTSLMSEKCILRVKDQFSDKIVAMAPSSTIYIDENFYQKAMGEDKNSSDSKSLPVKIFALRIGWILTRPEGKILLQQILSSDRLDFYEIPTLQMIIEFLYNQNKVILLRFLLPLYLIQGVVFLILIVFTEIHEQKEEEEMGEPEGLDFKYLSAFINLLISGIMVTIMVVTFANMGHTYLYRMYTWIDLIFYTLSFSVSLTSLLDSGLEDQRVFSAFALIFFLTKSFYYMKLIDQIAPLVDIIFRIFVDIGWFMFVFVLTLGALACSFYLIGQNQIMFDNLGEEDEVEYGTLGGALFYMWLMCLGAAESDSFEVGDASQNKYLVPLYIFSGFCIVIHMLNMLIAIMGETFGRVREVADQLKVKDHLQFIMDNWYLNSVSLGPPENIKYIISAVVIEEENEDHEILKRVEQEIIEFQDQVRIEQNSISKKQREHDLQLIQLNRNQERMMQTLIQIEKKLIL